MSRHRIFKNRPPLSTSACNSQPSYKSRSYVLVVGLSVHASALGVFEGVLDHGDAKDKGEGNEGRDGVDAGRAEGGDGLEDGDEEEVEVGDSAELLEEVLRDEIDVVVLCCLNLVGGVLAELRE